MSTPLPANDDEKQWHCVCKRFVSVGFAEIDEAQEHMRLTKHHGCGGEHKIVFIDLPYGARGSA